MLCLSSLRRVDACRKHDCIPTISERLFWQISGRSTPAATFGTSPSCRSMRLKRRRTGRSTSSPMARRVQQSNILDRDHGLVCESRHELYLLFSKWIRLNTAAVGPERDHVACRISRAIGGPAHPWRRCGWPASLKTAKFRLHRLGGDGFIQPGTRSGDYHDRTEQGRASRGA
jgi:hypothetical protein